MEKGPDKLSRRRFLGIASVAALTGVAGVSLYPFGESDKEKKIESEKPPIPEQKEAPEAAPHDLTFLAVEQKSSRYDMGQLAGVKFGDLLTRYTGIAGLVPAHANIDFKERLAKLWEAKLVRAKGESDIFPLPMMAVGKKVFDAYGREKVSRSNLVAYHKQIGDSISEVRANLDLSRIKKVQAFEDLTAHHMKVLRFLESKINPTSILAYSITELMPTRGGTAPIGIALYDFLLRNAGTEFIDSIPALGDNMISFGPYQFTSHALLETNAIAHGASFMQRALSIDKAKRHIPRSVAELRGNAQHKAAYLFGLYNLAHGVRKLSDAQAKVLDKNTQWADDEDVVAFIAAAHNRTGVTYKAFQSYVAAYIKKGKDMQHDLIDFIKMQSSLAGPYAEKSATNYTLLKERF